MPNDIIVEREPYCENCPDFDAMSEQSTMYADGEPYIVQISVHCRNKTLCARMWARLKKEMYKEESNV